MAKTVLVVDDMQSQLDLMSNYLSRAGYHVTTADSGAIALEKINANKPDIIITDLVIMVGELVSSLVLYTRCLRPSAHPLPLIVPSRFSLRNMRYARAERFSSGVRLLARIGSITFRLWSCSISLWTASTPWSPNRFIPCQTLYCMRTVD